MIADAIALIEFISNQFSKNQDKKDKLLEKFVEPAYSQLKFIHEDYMRACRKYWESIRYDQPLDIMKLVNEMDIDIRFAPHETRMELLSSIQLNDPQLQDFIDSIRKYLMGQTHAARTRMEYDLPPNRRVGLRTSLLEKLNQLSNINTSAKLRGFNACRNVMDTS